MKTFPYQAGILARPTPTRRGEKAIFNLNEKHNNMHSPVPSFRPPLQHIVVNQLFHL